MALQAIFGTLVNNSGDAVNLSTTDSAFVGANGQVSSGPGTGISGGGSLHTVDVQGTVLGWTFGIYLGSSSLTTGEHVLIETGGFVGSYSVNSAAVSIHGWSNVVENRGRVYGGSFGYGITFSDGQVVGTSDKLINSGTIEAGTSAVDHAGADMLVVINSGTISGGTYGYRDLSTGGGQVTNTGTIIGQIQFGAGNDSYSGASGHLAGHLLGGGGSDTAIGGIDNDWFEGGAGNDTLTGNGGADTLFGDAGNDTLSGGAGKDILTGGQNADFFVFNTPLNASTNVDQITDFSHVDDTIRLSSAIFKGMGSGALKSQYFYVGTKAHDADDHIIYNKATGGLYYDSDGTGAHAQVLFAVIADHATAGLAYNDFVLI